MRLLRIALITLLLIVLPPLAPARAVGDPSALQVACVMGHLSLRQKIGQLFMVGVYGTQPNLYTTHVLEAWQPGGIILFENNVSTAAALRSLIASARHTAHIPLLVATDQEGGPVTRIRVGLTPLPSPAYYGALGSTDRVYADTRAQGAALRALGINLDLAPVVDVRSSPYSAIGRRSFGSDPLLDARLVAAAIRGYQSSGIAATAKHFLGLGEVSANADLSLPVVTASRAVLEARDMVPMRAAVRADVSLMMVTRVLIPALDPTGTTAYASRMMIHDIVRGELGFKGTIITDSLLSRAVLRGPGPVTAALAALRAGDDILLLGTGYALDETYVTSTIAAVAVAVASGTIPISRIDDAVLHVLQLKAHLHLLPRC